MSVLGTLQFRAWARRTIILFRPSPSSPRALRRRSSKPPLSGFSFLIFKIGLESLAGGSSWPESVSECMALSESPMRRSPRGQVHPCRRPSPDFLGHLEHAVQSGNQGDVVYLFFIHDIFLSLFRCGLDLVDEGGWKRKKILARAQRRYL